MNAPRSDRTHLKNVREVAEYLGVDAGWVYEHAADLGAYKLGSGPRPRLRFSLERVDEFLSSCSVGRESGSTDSASVQRLRGRRRSGLVSVPDLLPIRGSRGAA